MLRFKIERNFVYATIDPTEDAPEDAKPIVLGTIALALMQDPVFKLTWETCMQHAMAVTIRALCGEDTEIENIRTEPMQ